MQIEEILQSGETILHEGQTDARADLRRALVTDHAVIKLIWVVLNLLLDIFLLRALGWIDMGPYYAIMPFQFLPLLLYVWDIYFAVTKKRNTHYWVTDCGIYVRMGVSEHAPIRYFTYDTIRVIGSGVGKFQVGDVNFEAGPTEAQRTGSGYYRSAVQMHLRSIPDSTAVAQMMKAQKQKYEARCKRERRQAQLNNRMQVTDPQLAFFGNTAAVQPAQNFVQEPVPEAELLGSLPEESVADLQAELFGADAAQQGAFPDTTVNPLPELSDAQNDQRSLFTQQ